MLENIAGIAEVAICFSFVCVLAIWANWRKRKTFDSYILADRQIPWYLVGFTLIGTWVGGGTLIGMAGKISNVGIAFIAVPVGVAVGFFFLGVLSSRYRHTRRETTATAKTLVQRLSDQYGSMVRAPVFLAISVLMILFMAVQLYVGALLIRERIGFDLLFSSLIFGGIVLIYTYVGGTRGDIWTDLFQVIVIFISIFVSFVFLVVKCSSLPVIASLKEIDSELLNVFRMGGFFIVGSLLLSTFAIHTDGGIQQKLLVASGDREAKRGAYLASIMYFVFGFLLIGVVILTVSFKGMVRGDQILLQMAERFIPFPFSFLFSIALLSAVLSTIDSELLLISGMFVNDMYKPFLSSKYGVNITDDDIGQYRLARAWIVVCFLLALGLSFIIGQLFDLISTLWVVGLGCLGLPLVGLVFKRIGEKMTGWFVASQIIWSALIVGLVFVWATTTKRDVTNQMVQLGILLLLVNFAAMWVIYGFKKLTAKPKSEK